MSELDAASTRNSSSASADGTPAERAWRRRCLWLVPVLFLLTAGLLMADSTMQWLGNRDLFARDIATGSPAEFGGAQWQLRTLQFAPSAMAQAGKPAGPIPVVVEFSAVVRGEDLPRRWQACRISLVDGQGRRWAPTSIPALRLPSTDARDCMSAAVSGAAKASVLRIRETFLIPPDAAATVRPTVGLAGERPYYLRFARP